LLKKEQQELWFSYTSFKDRAHFLFFYILIPKLKSSSWKGKLNKYLIKKKDIW